MSNIRRDGEYIIKTIPDPQMRKYFDFESYKKFRSQDNDWLVEVFDYNRKTGEITMAYIEGPVVFRDTEMKLNELGESPCISNNPEWRSKASYHELWNVCMTWRTSIIKKYFDFIFDLENDQLEKGSTEDWVLKPLIDENKQFFYHDDLMPHNVIVQDGKPIAIDPDSFNWRLYSDFIVKQHLLNERWWLIYLRYAHKRHL